MQRFQAKICRQWFDEQFNNHECFDYDDEVCHIRCLLKSIEDGELVTCVPFSDELLNEVYPQNENEHISHTTRTHYEDVGFNRACKVMISTGRMAKARGE